MKTFLILALLLCSFPDPLFSQWFWQNPKPQGNSLESISFVNENEGWVVGANGIILHTGNGGMTWGFQSGNLLATYSSVFFLDPMHGWIAGASNSSWELILRTTDGGNNWETVLDISCNTPIRDIRFTDAFIGWAVGDGGEIRYSMDGGSTWLNRFVPGIQDQSLGSVFFQDNLKGWIVGTNGTILRTIDGGLTWQTVPSPIALSLNSICFSSALKGTICGEQGTVLVTEDGGLTWTQKASGTTGNLAKVSFASAFEGLISGAVMLKSTDGGSTWQLVNSSNGYLNGCFPVTTAAYGAGANGRIAKSADGGATWYDLSSGTNKDTFRNAFFLDENTGWLLENGNRILFTTDGGDMWNGIDTLTFFSDDFVFTDPLNGWSAGTGQIAHTEDGGHSWNIQFQDTLHSLYLRDIFFRDASHGWAAGSDTVLYTVNGGTSWVKLPIGPITPFALYFIDQNTGWIVGDQGKIMKSTDGGVTWSVKASGTDAELHDVTFADPYHGWAVGHHWSGGYTSVVLKTSDGGESWDYQELPGGQWLYSVAFPDSLSGWISGSYGHIFHTQDGGITWEQQANLTDNYLYTISFVNDQTGWATGTYGAILKTTNGGIVGIKPNVITNNTRFISAYPNPAGSTTVIRYQVKKESMVQLTLYDIAGCPVKKLVNTWQPRGCYETILDVSNLSSGLYFCKIQMNGSSETKKIIVSR